MQYNDKPDAEAVEDWPEAVRWVSRAVKLESERLMKDGHNSPDSFLKAEALRKAWKRILRG
jgi:hypothetical protein